MVSLLLHKTMAKNTVWVNAVYITCLSPMKHVLLYHFCPCAGVVCSKLVKVAVNRYK